MKSAPVIAAIALLLAGASSAQAKQVRRHSHHHKAHIRHSHFAGKANLHPRPAPRPASIPVSIPVAVASYAPPRAITALPLPPSDAPEFGILESKAVRTSAITAVAGKTDSPASIAAARKNLTQVAMLKAPTTTGSAAMTPPTPAAISSPAVASPAVVATQPVAEARVDHPTPIILPEPKPEPPASIAAPRAIVPEHEDDDQPAAAMTGGYVALSRVANPRQFPELVPLRGYDISASATTIFSRPLTTTGTQTTNPTVGFFLSFHRHTDYRWLDIEGHYGLNQTSTNYAATGTQPAINLSRLSQEFSADLLVRRHLNRAKPYRALPYLGLGGGMLHFRETSNGTSSLTPTALVDAGIDIPTNSQHLSLRIGSHVLAYPTPNFGNPAISGWSVSTQPAAGVLFHF